MYFTVTEYLRSDVGLSAVSVHVSSVHIFQSWAWVTAECARGEGKLVSLTEWQYQAVLCVAVILTFKHRPGNFDRDICSCISSWWKVLNSCEETCSRLLDARDEGKVSDIIVMQISCGLYEIIVALMCARWEVSTRMAHINSNHNIDMNRIRNTN